MSCSNFEELKKHIGHKIVCVGYGETFINSPYKQFPAVNIAIECETCNEVLLDFDKE